jgi:uncharacterized protein YpmS
MILSTVSFSVLALSICNLLILPYMQKVWIDPIFVHFMNYYSEIVGDIENSKVIIEKKDSS